MADDSYTDLDRAELKQTVLESLLVSKKNKGNCHEASCVDSALTAS